MYHSVGETRWAAPAEGAAAHSLAGCSLAPGFGLQRVCTNCVQSASDFDTWAAISACCCAAMSLCPCPVPGHRYWIAPCCSRDSEGR